MIAITVIMYSLSTAHMGISLSQNLIGFFEQDAARGGLTILNDQGSPLVYSQIAIEIVNVSKFFYIALAVAHMPAVSSRRFYSDLACLDSMGSQLENNIPSMHSHSCWRRCESRISSINTTLRWYTLPWSSFGRRSCTCFFAFSEWTRSLQWHNHSLVRHLRRSNHHDQLLCNLCDRLPDMVRTPIHENICLL